MCLSVSLALTTMVIKNASTEQDNSDLGHFWTYDTFDILQGVMEQSVVATLSC